LDNEPVLVVSLPEIRSPAFTTRGVALVHQPPTLGPLIVHERVVAVEPLSGPTEFAVAA
jgi:hypothetical protein